MSQPRFGMEEWPAYIESPYQQARSREEQSGCIRRSLPAEQVQDWIGYCNILHERTCVPPPISSWDPGDVPKWLVDTLDQFIVPGSAALRYVALSYVWPESRAVSDNSAFFGASPLSSDLSVSQDVQYSSVSTSHSVRQKQQLPSLRLVREVMDECRAPGYLGRQHNLNLIPAVIRFAMQLTKEIKERYLWVDRLCIVQDDLDPSGTLSQISKMDKIYEGAYLTIIAAACDDLYSLDDVEMCVWPSELSILATAQRDRQTCSPTTHRPKASIYDLYQWLGRSRWASRGWTYQEQILCRRALILTDQGQFWDCLCATWDNETNPFDSAPRAISHYNDMGQRFSTRWWPDFGFYLDLVCPYNGRQFSFPEDAVKAVLGILHKLGVFQGGFVHGLPRLFLDHALLWQPFGFAEQRTARHTSQPVLPTWSWMAWQCYIEPSSLRSGLWYIGDEASQQRVKSLRTFNLVTWHLMHDCRPSEAIEEPLLLEGEYNEGHVPGEWQWCCAKREPSGTQYNSENNPCFIHPKDQETKFYYPIPIKSPDRNCELDVKTTKLWGNTSTAIFRAAAVLEPSSWRSITSRGASKISAFEHALFHYGPPSGKSSRILVLQQSCGAFAGLLRLMTATSEVGDTERGDLKLVAISRGQMSAGDLLRTSEWTVFAKGDMTYKYATTRKTHTYVPSWIGDNGKMTLMYDLISAFWTNAENTDFVQKRITQDLQVVEGMHRKLSSRKARSEPSESDEICDANGIADVDKIAEADETSGADKSSSAPWASFVPDERSNDKEFKDWFDIRTSFLNQKARQVPICEGLTCEFYNVLWVEEIDGVSFRRACGWVPKYVWEACCSKPVEVVLG